MRQVTTFISTYTADVSAVCSALYEMGGMLVIHDPSGCNSTYNTHDEPRWYDLESLIFISGLSEIDAIMGNDEKFINDILKAAELYKPKFIVILQTPVPYMMGTDFLSISEEVQSLSGIDTYYIPTNGMHSYLWGIGEAQKLLAKYFVEEMRKESEKRSSDRIRVNLLGVTPLDFSVNSTLQSIKNALEDENCEVWSCFSMKSCFHDGKEIRDIRDAAGADVNLVLSGAGLPAARILKERFRIPYLTGMPVDNLMENYMEFIQKAVCTNENQSLLQCVQSKTERAYAEKAKGILIGEAVTGQSIALAIQKKYGSLPRVICPQETETEILGENAEVMTSEEEIASALKNVDYVIADPMFNPICPQNCKFYPLAQECCSGRIYRKEIPDLFQILSHKE